MVGFNITERVRIKILANVPKKSFRTQKIFNVFVGKVANEQYVFSA